MKKAKVYLYNIFAGVLTEEEHRHYTFRYNPDYHGAPISLTMPVTPERYHFNTFPPFFEGLLPEGLQLDGLLRNQKIDKQDYFTELIATGQDLVGAVTVLPDE